MTGPGPPVTEDTSGGLWTASRVEPWRFLHPWICRGDFLSPVGGGALAAPHLSGIKLYYYIRAAEGGGPYGR